jgi:hypothetical protein
MFRNFNKCLTNIPIYLHIIFLTVLVLLRIPKARSFFSVQKTAVITFAFDDESDSEKYLLIGWDCLNYFD